VSHPKRQLYSIKVGVSNAFQTQKLQCNFAESKEIESSGSESVNITGL
jgi:hypothetical protein